MERPGRRGRKFDHFFVVSCEEEFEDEDVDFSKRHFSRHKAGRSVVDLRGHLFHVARYDEQGRIPGTDRWKPINESAEAQEDIPGTLIVRIRDNLDFGVSRYRISNGLSVFC